jgi:hypothetical protein
VEPWGEGVRPGRLLGDARLTHRGIEMATDAGGEFQLVTFAELLETRRERKHLDDL